MISISQLKQKAKRKYWEVLTSCMQGGSLFPLVIPADKNLPTSFEALRRAVGELVTNAKSSKGYGYRLTSEERNTRRYGIQSIPTCISFDCPDDFFRFIGRKSEAEKILRRAEELVGKIPVLKQWVEHNPQKLCKYLDEWESIINVLVYFRENPRPGMYTRELPINVHTKFIEGHKGILRELLEYVIPDHINREGDTFEKRFHLKFPAPLIRMRRLDSACDAGIFTLSDDLALPVDVFNRLEPRSRHVIIVENQMTFLTLPPLESTIAVYGGGFKVEILKEAVWLKTRTIIYWGDIDEHGFLILSLVRRYFPGVISIMMNEETFFRFRDLCGPGVCSGEKADNELNLTLEEIKLYRLVREGNYRLEQEHLPRDYTVSRLQKLVKSLVRPMG